MAAANGDAARGHIMAGVREGDHDRFLCALYAPEDKREGLFALYAFNVEIASIRNRIREPMPGEIRLQWWRDALERGAGGNPVAEALRDTVRIYRLPLQPFLDYLDARVFDLYDDPMPSRTDLEGYCGETASALIQLASLILDSPAAAGTADLAGHAGCAQAIAGLLRLMPLHRSRGQCYIPAEILSACGLTRDEFVTREPGEAHRCALDAMVALGREHLARFREMARALPLSLRPAYLPLALTGAYLGRVEAAGEDALKKVADISAPRKHMLLLRRAQWGWR